MKPTTIQESACALGKETKSKAIVKGVAVDTRLTRPGDLFFALPGDRVDGHTFLEQAAKSGAAGAVVKTGYQEESFGLALIHVDDVLEALQNLAKNILQRSHARIVAVTGSLGKTTTKGFIVSLLKNKYRVTASPGNSNSQIGLPLAIINEVTLEEDLIVLEMGMTLPGQISKLIQIAPPHIAVVTTVALVHACSFDSIDDIARAKSEIFTHPATEIGIYHRDVDHQGVLSQSGVCEKLSFSTTSPEADFYMTSDAIIGPSKIPEHFPPLAIPGAHNKHNFLCAVAVAKCLGMSTEEIIAAQAQLELPERRLQFIEKCGALFINDAYNASELSIKAALNSLPEPKPGGKKIAVLGGIVELGKFSEACHRAVGEYALDRVDHLFCFGDDCLPIAERWLAVERRVVWGENRGEVVAALRKELQPGDVVLLKGSRAKEVWKVLDEL